MIIYSSERKIFRLYSVISLEEHLKAIEKLKQKHPYVTDYVILASHIVGKDYPHEEIDELFAEIVKIVDEEMLKHLYRLNSVEKKEFDRRRFR